MERSERSIGRASATRRTGRRNRFAEAGEMLRLTTGLVRSGCDTVIVAVWRRAAGGTMTVKLPTATVPPRRPMVFVLVVVELEPPPRRLRPSTPAGAVSVAIAVSVAVAPDPSSWGFVCRSEHPATASRAAKLRARVSANREPRDFMIFSFMD